MGAVSPVHLIIVLVVALLVLGPGKLPETGEALGKAVRDFRRALAEDPPASPSGVESAIVDSESDHPA
ncbi:MAG: twin-arginine translocase TatA/TatE family subunit [Betaproteobacteria bacterium]